MNVLVESSGPASMRITLLLFKRGMMGILPLWTWGRFQLGYRKKRTTKLIEIKSQINVKDQHVKVHYFPIFQENPAQHQ